MVCPTCGTELTPKSKARLITVGVLLLATLPAILLSRWFIPVALLATLIAVYLFAWATKGQGLWCRTCKRAPYLSN